MNTMDPRICIVYSWDYKKHTIINYQNESLCRLGYQVIVVDLLAGRISIHNKNGCIEKKPKIILRICCRLIISSFIIFISGFLRIFSIWINKLIIWLKAIKTIPLLVDIKADLYQAHDIESLLQSTYSGRILNKKVIYVAHEMTSDTGIPGTKYNKAIRTLEEKYIPLADYLVMPESVPCRYL